MTHCLCNHNTFYGSSFFVMPNPIDLSQTGALFATITQNYVVAAVLGGFFFLYLILVVWAWYADKKVLRTVQTTSTFIQSKSMIMLTREREMRIRSFFLFFQRKAMLLEDNHPCAHYNYLVNVQTGNRKQAGTSAKVCASDSTGQFVTSQEHIPLKSKYLINRLYLFFLITRSYINIVHVHRK